MSAKPTLMDPQVAAALSTQQYQQRQAAAEKVTPTPTIKPTLMDPQVAAGLYAQEQQAKAIQASQGFYTSLGYPQYAGKYSPFTVPEGYTVSSIKEVPDVSGGTKLDIALQPKPRAAGIAATVESGSLPHLNLTDALLGLFGIQPKRLPIMEASRTAQVDLSRHLLAGMIAPAESLFYGVSDILHIPWEHPEPPPTVLGAGISSGISTGLADITGSKEGRVGLDLGGKLASALGIKPLPLQRPSGIVLSPEAHALGEHSIEYGIGTVVGDILLALGISKGIEAVSKSSMAQRLASRVRDVSRELRGVKYAKDVSEGFVGLPTLTEVPPSAAEEALVKGSLGMTPQDIRDLPSLQAGEDILGFTEFPHTTGIGLTMPYTQDQLALLTAKKAVDPVKDAMAAVTGFYTYPELAMEKWTARAGYLDEGRWLGGTEPADKPFYMLTKGGKPIDLGSLSESLGFSRTKWSMGSSGALSFEKETLPSEAQALKFYGETASAKGAAAEGVSAAQAILGRETAAKAASASASDIIMSGLRASAGRAAQASVLTKSVFGSLPSTLSKLESMPRLKPSIDTTALDLLGVKGILDASTLEETTTTRQRAGMTDLLKPSGLSRAVLGQPSRLKRGQEIKPISSMSERESELLIPDVATGLGLKLKTTTTQKLVTTTPTTPKMPSPPTVTDLRKPTRFKKPNGDSGGGMDLAGALGFRRAKAYRKILTKIATPKEAAKWSMDVSGYVFGKKETRKVRKHRK